MYAEVSAWQVRRKETENQDGGEDLSSGTQLVVALSFRSEQIFVELRMQGLASIYTRSDGA